MFRPWPLTLEVNPWVERALRFCVWKMSNINHLFVAAFLFVWSIVEGYPHGAPIDICDTLSPMRTHGLPLQSSNSPYVLLQTAVSYKQGQVINGELIYYSCINSIIFISIFFQGIMWVYNLFWHIYEISASTKII